MKKLTKDIFTTGEVAKICNVSLRTVIKWFDSGLIQGYVIPGTKDRRIPRNSLIGFMKENNIPISVLDQVQKGELIEYCWEFFNRTKPEREKKVCDDCIVFQTHTLECYELTKKCHQRSVLCGSFCKDCEYFLNVWNGNEDFSGDLSQKQPCWDYFREKKTDMTLCQDCIAFKTKAIKCFEFSKSLGLPRNYQTSNCTNCTYYLYLSEILHPDGKLI